MSIQTITPDRVQAFTLLRTHTKNEHLIWHALAVESVMRYFAKKYEHEEEKWGIIGLIHDLDYEQYPEQHCKMTKQILEENGWPSDWIRAVMSHGWETCTDVEPIDFMEKVLYTVDELTGLVTATALVRPSRSILDMEVSSVKKKWKAKGFAAGVNREIIEKGASLLAMDLNMIISDTIAGMRTVAEQIGLSGTVKNSTSL